jgi:hypothetical protein
MHMETTQHQFTFVRLNFRHNKQFTDGSEEVSCSHRIIGQIVIENYFDIGTGPHPTTLRAEVPKAMAFSRFGKAQIRPRAADVPRQVLPYERPRPIISESPVHRLLGRILRREAVFLDQ